MGITKSYTFTNNTTIDPDEVNQNFDDLLDSIKAAHHSDEDGTAIDDGDIAAGFGLVPSGCIIMWSGALDAIPTGWVLCDGNNSTPNLIGKFIQGAGAGYAVGATGGSASSEHNHTHSHTHTLAHTHTYSGTSGTNDATEDGGDGSGSVANNVHRHGYSGTTSGASATTTSDANNTATSGASATENRPPFYTMAFIMKV